MKSHSLMFNSVFNVIYRVLNIVFPLVTASYIARVINSKLIGEVAYAQNITQYFVLVAALGLPNYGTKAISNNRSELDKANKVFTELFIINMVSTTCCLLAYYSIVYPLFKFSKLYAVTGLSIVLNYINVDWLYQGYEQYSYIAIRSFFVKALALVATLLLVKSSNDYIVYAFINVVAVGGNYIYNIFHLKYLGVRFSFRNLDLGTHIKPVLVLLCTTIAIELYTMLDTTMLGFWCSKEYVAYYNYSMRITKSIIAVIAAIGAVLLPRLSYYHGIGDDGACSRVVGKAFDVLIYLLIPSCLCICVCSREIVLVLYGDTFIPSINVLRISTLLIITLGFSNLFGTQILITFAKEKQLLLSTIIGASINICMNCLLLKRYNAIGATIASVASETAVTLVTYYFATRVLFIRFPVRDFITSIIASLVVLISIVTLKIFIDNQIVLLCCEVPVAVIIYATVSLMLHNQIAIELFERLRKIIPIKCNYIK